MKFRALALDYDGTIAQDGNLNPDVRAAIAEIRACGTVVVIVTGRTLADMKRIAGDLDFVDAVVAENGAVLELPNRYSRLIASPPPALFSKNSAAEESRSSKGNASWNRMALWHTRFWTSSASLNCRWCCCSTVAAS